MKASGAEAFERLLLLETELRLVAAQWVAAPDEVARRLSVLTLAAVVDFINGDQDWRAENLGAPLYRLMLALQHIDDGLGEDWLTPKYNRSGPRIPGEITAMRLRCSVALQWLMQARPKLTREDAAQKVLHQLGEERACALLAVRTGKQTELIKWQEIARWREIVMTGTAKERAPFDALLGRLTAMYGTDVPRAAAERHCAAIIEGAVKLSPKNSV